jgi:glutaconate CoA-transferase subunit B
VITDKGILTPDPETCELTLTSLHPGVTVTDARESIGWDLRVSPDLTTTPPPTSDELAVLRGLTNPEGSR